MGFYSQNEDKGGGLRDQIREIEESQRVDEKIVNNINYNFNKPPAATSPDLL